MTLKFIHCQLHTPRSRPLSRPQSSQAFIHVTYSTLGTRFLALLYHPRHHSRSNPFRNLFNSFLNSLISSLILPTSSSCCSTPLPLLALSLLLAFSILTLSFLLLTLSVIPSFLSSISLSLPTVQRLATPSCIPVYGLTTPFRLSSTPFSPSSVSLPLSPKTHLIRAISQSPDVSMSHSSYTS